MKYHALYIRVSTEAQAEEGFSIVAQKERLLAYGVAMGWEHTRTFVDGGFSGSHLDRPSIEDLINNVRQGEVASVVVYKLDRLSRSQKDTLYLIEDVFLPHNVDFISLNESIDTSTPYGRAMIGILSAFAQLERENIYLRTRMGMLERVKQGYWMGGGSTPYGYLYDKEQGILVPHPEESYIVTQVYQLYLQGESPQKIAQLLGLSYDKLVTQIISRRSNLGLISYKGKEYQGRHEPIISQDIFDLAQEKRKSRNVNRRSSGVHLLSGLVYCKACGSRMRYIKWGKNGYKLRCYSQDPSKEYMSTGCACASPAVWAKTVEDIVVSDITSLSTDLRDKSPIRHVPNLDKLILQEEKKLKKLYHLYGEGEDSLLLDTISECKKSLSEYYEKQAKESQLQQQSAHLESLQQRIFSLGESWHLLSPLQKQEILKDCIEKIELHKDDVVIHYHLLVEKDREKVATLL